MKKLVYGVGVNDANYSVNPRVNGKRVACPFYSKWAGMLERCYSDKYQLRQPTYIGCTVCEEWLTFSNFKAWMEQQDWQGKELDKDILKPGNKVYRPDVCVFVDSIVNTFTITCGASRGQYPLGVCIRKLEKKFNAQCRNPFTKKREHLGSFTCQDEAHQAWKKRKHELSCQLADLQDNSVIAAALRVMYA